MKAILEFNLPEDNTEYLATVKAMDMVNFIFELIYNSKKQCIHNAEQNNKNFDELDFYDGVDLVYDKIYELLEYHNISIDELT
jgi:hypothetical protein